MSLLMIALQPSFTKGLLEVTSANSARLSEIMSKDSGYYAQFDKASSSWELDFATHVPIAKALASECSRLAAASFQSFSEVESYLGHARSTAWGLIRGYYSAFYAGHALLRVLGGSCTYLDGSRLGLIQQVFDAQGVVEKISRGLYEIRTADKGQILLVKAVPNNGAHEGFWKIFHARLDELASRVLTEKILSDTDAQQVWGVLNSWIQLLSRRGGHVSWLSEVRNSIQYRQERDVWHPKKLRAADYGKLKRIASGWSSEPEDVQTGTTAGELGRFVAVCTFLVALCRATLLRIASRSINGRSFAETGPLSYLRLLEQKG